MKSRMHTTAATPRRPPGWSETLFEEVADRLADCLLDAVEREQGEGEKVDRIGQV